MALAALPPADRRRLLCRLSEEEAKTLLYDWPFWARPEQLPPPGKWRIFLLLGGRGSGKSRAAAEYVTAEVMAGRARHVAVVGRTAADVRDVMAGDISGTSGLVAIAPPWFPVRYEPSKRRLTWPNGATATLYSADEPDLLRGPQHDLAWCDELAAWDRAQETWDNLMLGLRLGQARCVVSTTPRRIPLVRDLLARAGRDVALSRMPTYDNLPNLSPDFARDILARFEGTRLGRQELHAELLTNTPGALWTYELLERTRHRGDLPPLARVVVAVDPAASSGEGAAQTGIIVAGAAPAKRGQPPECFVLDDLTMHGTPHEWADQAVRAYEVYRADRIVVERNNGGEMVEATIRTIDASVPVKTVWASRGKAVRAEPVAALYERGLVHHVDLHPQLEDSMASWAPGEPSPDRLDALVWAIWALAVDGKGLGGGGRMASPDDLRRYDALLTGLSTGGREGAPHLGGDDYY